MSVTDTTLYWINICNFASINLPILLYYFRTFNITDTYVCRLCYTLHVKVHVTCLFPYQVLVYYLITLSFHARSPIPRSPILNPKSQIASQHAQVISKARYFTFCTLFTFLTYRPLSLSLSAPGYPPIYPIHPSIYLSIPSAHGRLSLSASLMSSVHILCLHLYFCPSLSFRLHLSLSSSFFSLLSPFSSLVQFCLCTRAYLPDIAHSSAIPDLPPSAQMNLRSDTLLCPRILRPSPITSTALSTCLFLPTWTENSARAFHYDGSTSIPLQLSSLQRIYESQR